MSRIGRVAYGGVETPGPAITQGFESHSDKRFRSSQKLQPRAVHAFDYIDS